jgi:hypothetical protein
VVAILSGEEEATSGAKGGGFRVSDVLGEGVVGWGHRRPARPPIRSASMIPK